MMGTIQERGQVGDSGKGPTAGPKPLGWPRGVRNPGSGGSVGHKSREDRIPRGPLIDSGSDKHHLSVSLTTQVVAFLTAPGTLGGSWCMYRGLTLSTRSWVTASSYFQEPSNGASGTSLSPRNSYQQPEFRQQVRSQREG